MKALLRIAVTLGLLLLLSWKLDWGQVAAQLAQLKWWTLALAIGLHAAAISVGNLRWWMLLRSHESGFTPTGLLGPYFIGAFFNNLLPTATGGDLYRMYYIYKRNQDATLAVSPVLVERFVGFLAMAGIAAAVAPFLPTDDELLGLLRNVLPVVFGLCIFGLVLVSSRRTYRPVHDFVGRWSRFRLVAALLHVAEACHEYLRAPRIVLTLFGLSVALQLTQVLIFFLLGVGVGADAPFATFMFLVPIILFSAALPVTVGGFGVRETAAIVLLTAAGISQDKAAAISLLYIPVILIASLPGLLLFLRMDKKDRPTGHAPPA